MKWLVLLGGAVGLHAVASEPDAWQIRAGAALANTPTYEGADTRRWRLLPSVEVTGKSFQAGREGLNFNLAETEKLRWGVGAGFYFARKETDDTHLTGMGNIPFVPTLTTSVTLGDRRLNAQVRLAHAVSPTVKGNELGLTLRTGYPLKEGLLMTLMANASVMDAPLMQTYFGVSPEQSARTGFAAQKMTGGVYKTGLGVGAIVRLDDGWTLVPLLMSSRLRGQTLLSPIVTQAAQFTALVALTKTF